MQTILIIGAGGHGQVIADAIMQAAEAGQAIKPIGYLDDNPAQHGQQLLGLPVLGSVAMRTQIAHDALVIAIGNNRIRQRVYTQLRAQGESFATIIHPTAIIAAGVVIGAGTMICARVVINPGATIGANVILNTASTIDHHNQIGDHVHIAPGVHTGGDVIIEEGGFIGIGAIVMPQRRVGAWSTIGAAGLVQRDIPAGVVAVGVPAQIRGLRTPVA